MNNLRFLFFTNEKNIMLGELCLKYFFKHNTREDIKVSLVSNKFNDHKFEYEDKVKYLDGNVDYQYNGGHFAKTLLNTLDKFDEEYIFFFCDDYFLFRDIKYSDLEETLQMIYCNDVDYFGLDDIGLQFGITEFDKFNSKCEYKFNDKLYLRNNNYQYLFSVQPCIWKKKSLINLLNKHDYITLHNLDNTLPVLKQNNTLLCLAIDLKSLFNGYILKDDNYFMFAYYEIVRHGCFYIPENGNPISPEEDNVKFIKKLIEEENLINRQEFRGKIYMYYDIYNRINNL